MTDRELLELAAKAAGIELLWTCGGQPVNVPTLFKGLSSDEVWNPLTDDGDALRLAVKLNLTIKIMGDHVKVGWRGCGEQWPGEEVPCNADTVMPIATRRAIVRAAAEIGRSME